jgi:hypothetical protein
MSEHSNVDEVTAAIDDIIKGFGFDLTVSDKTLGHDCVEIFATDVQNKASQGIGSEGAWKENAADYASMKERVYGVDEGPNIRTGQMLSILSLSNAEINHESVDLEYGTDTIARDGVKGRPVKNADKKLTDRQKAAYAHAGQGPEGTERPFYAISAEAATAIQEKCQARLDDFAFERWNQA